MGKICVQCERDFEVTDEDRAFLDKVSPIFGGVKYAIPEPTHCPDCRKQRRMAFRNEFFLYQDQCDLTGKRMLSIYSPDKPFKVYDREIWFSDRWDPLSYGREFDFNRTFFEQFGELMLKVPRLNLVIGDSCENCDYTNQIATCKGCYLCFTMTNSQDCLYGYRSSNSKTCIDTFMTQESELCYECIDAVSSYRCFYSQQITNCRDSFFLYDCQNCSDCLFSINLRNKQYCIWNKQYTRDEYFEALKSFCFQSFSQIQVLQNQFLDFKLQFPHRFAQLLQSEDITGDGLRNAKNCHHVFDGIDIQDVSYSHFIQEASDCMDINFGAECTQLSYEVFSVGLEAYHVLFCNNVWPLVSDLIYCDSSSHGSRNLFGCVGLRGKQYCILNKQYSQKEYEEIVPRIIEHMCISGEWGEFFPISLSPFAYNEMNCFDYFPLTKEQSLQRGWKWLDENVKERQIQTYSIPDQIQNVKDDVLLQVLTCEQCGKNFKIIQQELAFYCQQGIPIPRKCFLCRHRNRFAKRNPRKLWERSCMKCGISIQTTYSPERSERVYCDQCFLKEVY